MNDFANRIIIKMIIFPTENPANRFVHAPKALFEDDTISWKAKGMIAWMASHSENYTLHISVLIKKSKEGRDAVYSGLKEICNSPYGRRIGYQDSKGHHKSHYAVSVTPHSNEEWDSFLATINRTAIDDEENTAESDTYPSCGKSTQGKSSQGKSDTKIYKENKTYKEKEKDQDTCANEFALVENEIAVSDVKQTKNEVIAEAFIELWKPWHNKKNKPASEKAFKTLCFKLGTNPHLIAKDILEDSLKRLEAKQIGFDKIHLSSYINGKRWEDDITANVNAEPVDKLAQAMGMM